MKIKTPAEFWQCILGPACAGFIIPMQVAWAADSIITDGTMGEAQTLSGINITIPQNLGTTAGNNLFHSFTEFNIASGQTVNFTGSSTLQNIISRVTGSHLSNIDGTLKSSIANAAFYLINPNGITFKSGASVDVPGAFHASTADKIDFANSSGVFYADNSKTSTLSSDAPSAFGFLDTSAVNNGLINVNGSHLSMENGQALDMVAGEIKVENRADIYDPSGQIRLVALQEPGTVSLTQNADGKLPLPALSPSPTNAGRLDVNSSAIDTSGDGGGRIALWGGDAAFTDSKIYADNNGARDATSAKGINVLTYSLKLDNSWLTYDAMNTGRAGSVTVESINTLNIANGRGIATNAYAEGEAGNLLIRAGALDISNSGLISSSTFAQGDAGNITVIADNLRIDGKGTSDATGILATAEQDSSGRAGHVTLQVGSLDIVNGGYVASSTSAQGDAGSVTIKANSIKIDDQVNAFRTTGIFSQANKISNGNAGNVTVNTEVLDILNGGVITSSTFAAGNAGNVAVTANTLRIEDQVNAAGATGILSQANQGSGHGGSVIVKAGMLDILGGGIISSSTFAEGNAGNVSVTADTLTINGERSSFSTGITSQAKLGSGNAGNMSIQAGKLAILNGGTISSSTFAQGSAGSVGVSGGMLEISSGGIISSASWGAHSSGMTGDVLVTANDWLHLGNGGHISIENQANLSTDAAASINPGFISVTAPAIDMRNSEITSNSTGNVSAGSIVVNFAQLLTMHPSFINTTANTGNGGSIIVNGGELIYLQNSGFKTTVNGENGNGGDIFTTANTLVMDNGLIQANAVSGSGGNINLSLDSLIPSANTLLLGGSPLNWQQFAPGFNVIQAASQAGVSGTVSVTAPQLNLSGIIANLGGPQFDMNIISQDYCGLGTDSSLTRKGFGGIMPKSGDQLPF